MNDFEVPQSKYMNALDSAPKMNTKSNIIAGPGPRDFWFHSPGAQRPLVNEDGPFPVQGNIGSLLKQEPDYTACSQKGSNEPDAPDIGSGPNCTGVFKADMFTTSDTCGSACKLSYPESYGLKDFGFPEDMPSSQKISNAHQVHAYQNIRAGMAGQMGNTGCYEWLPTASVNPVTGACEMTQNPVYSQVGNWNFLPVYSGLQSVNYTPYAPTETIVETVADGSLSARRR
jgi:hypothetical protein